MKDSNHCTPDTDWLIVSIIYQQLGAITSNMLQIILMELITSQY